MRRSYLYPMFDAFDPPEVMTSCARRLETTVPTQALTLLNRRVTFEEARAFANRLLKECGEHPMKILPRAWLLAFSRPITKAETSRALAFLRERQKTLMDERSESTKSTSWLKDTLTELCLALFNANEFTYID